MDNTWLPNDDDRGPDSLSYPVLPLDHFLLHAAHKYPQRTATLFPAPTNGRLSAARLSYKQLNQAVNHFATGLQQLGVKKGDRVALALPNCPQFIIAAYATWRIGGIVVGLNPFARPADLAHMLDDSGSETLVIRRRLYARIQSIRSRTNLQQVIVSRTSDYLPWPAATAELLKDPFLPRTKGASRTSTVPFQRLLRGKTTRLRLIEVMPPDTAVILYPHTRARNQPGISLSHRNLVTNITMINHRLGTKAGQEVALGMMPFYDAFGLTAVLCTAVAQAATLILLPNPRDIGQAVRALEQFHVTYLPGVPKLLAALLQHSQQKKGSFAAVRLVLSSKSTLPLPLRQQFEAVTSGRLLNAYGLTEASGLVAIDPWQHPRPQAVGLPLPDTEVQIADVAFGTQALPIGEIGEVVVRGPQVMAGYWQRPEVTAEVVRVGPDGSPGWLYTGDLGFLDSAGYLHITTPRQDPITRGMNRLEL
ncbi:MAG: AMP-binding protein [Ardenticatenaceae bacterium]|nr:AMP-binding protein [Ardenticatenaceae bacterium]